MYGSGNQYDLIATDFSLYSFFTILIILFCFFCFCFLSLQAVVDCDSCSHLFCKCFPRKLLLFFCTSKKQPPFALGLFLSRALFSLSLSVSQKKKKKKRFESCRNHGCVGYKARLRYVRICMLTNNIY